MKSTKLFLLVTLLLASCAAPVKSAQTATGAFTPEPTITQTFIPTSTITPTSTKTPIPEKTFQVCKIEDYKNCEILAEDLLSGAYWQWLQTLSKPFNPAKIKDVPFEMVQENWGNTIVYNFATAPNFDDPTTRPFRRDVTAGVTYIDYSENKVPYLILPIEYFDKNHPEHNKWVIAVYSTYGGIPPGINEYIPVPNPDSIIGSAIRMWKNDMNTTPIVASTITQLTLSEDPLIRKVFDKYQDMPDRFQRFANGDLSALSQPGIIVNTEIFSGSGLYK